VSQDEDGGPFRGRQDDVGLVGVDTVQADQGVVVHDPAPLVFGDLAVGQTYPALIAVGFRVTSEQPVGLLFGAPP
jgi:hypothetical protein